MSSRLNGTLVIYYIFASVKSVFVTKRHVFYVS